MAAKVHPNHRHNFLRFSPREAKQNWRLYPLMDDNAQQWDERKYGVMFGILLDKFQRNLDLKQKLIDTGDKHLEEKNSWGDTYWGVDETKGGRNELGKVLMNIRILVRNNITIEWDKIQNGAIPATQE